MEGNRASEKKEEVVVEPNFGLSGALAEDTNKVDGVSLVYTEPPEAANPTLRWRLYTFKGGTGAVHASHSPSSTCRIMRIACCTGGRSHPAVASVHLHRKYGGGGCLS
jgi:hypothetical protein